MIALRLAVAFALVISCLAQFNNYPGYYGQTGLGGGFGGGFGAPSSFNRYPLGYATAGVPGAVAPNAAVGPVAPGVARVPAVGYDPYFSTAQQIPIYADNLGYDASSSRLSNCVYPNGLRNQITNLCDCRRGFKGADCNQPEVDMALNSSPGVVCQQQPGDLSRILNDQREYELASPEVRLSKNLERLMASAGRPSAAPLVGPGFGAFCRRVDGRMAPVHLKSAITDYGYVVCTANQLCYNRACGLCTAFNPRSGVCDSIPNPAARGLPRCAQGAGEAPAALKVAWRQAVLARPKVSAEMRPAVPGAPVGGVAAPNAPVGNAFAPPYSSPFYPNFSG